MVRENCGKYGDRTVQFCNRVCLGNSVVSMGIGKYSFAKEGGWENCGKFGVRTVHGILYPPGVLNTKHPSDLRGGCRFASRYSDTFDIVF
jgi:hypothetical protein